jgi:hypothetical protein
MPCAVAQILPEAARDMPAKNQIFIDISIGWVTDVAAGEVGRAEDSDPADGVGIGPQMRGQPLERPDMSATMRRRRARSIRTIE